MINIRDISSPYTLSWLTNLATAIIIRRKYHFANTISSGLPIYSNATWSRLHYEKRCTLQEKRSLLNKHIADTSRSNTSTFRAVEVYFTWPTTCNIERYRIRMTLLARIKFNSRQIDICKTTNIWKRLARAVRLELDFVRNYQFQEVGKKSNILYSNFNIFFRRKCSTRRELIKSNKQKSNYDAAFLR